MAVVYWIHLAEHTDITSEGYVGASKSTAKHRMVGHNSSARTGSELIVHKALRKYSDKILVATVVEGSDEYCYEVENKLRPSAYTGWNSAVGGDQVTMLGRKHSEATKSAMSVSRKAAGLTAEHLEKMRIARPPKDSKMFIGWLNPKANKAIWLDAEELYTLYCSYPSCGQKRLAKASGKYTSDSLETVTAKFKSGWNPSADSDYIKWKATNG